MLLLSKLLETNIYLSNKVTIIYYTPSRLNRPGHRVYKRGFKKPKRRLRSTALIILGDVFDSNPCASNLSWLSSSQSYLFDFTHSRPRVQRAQVTQVKMETRRMLYIRS